MCLPKNHKYQKTENFLGRKSDHEIINVKSSKNDKFHDRPARENSDEIKNNTKLDGPQHLQLWVPGDFSSKTHRKFTDSL